MSDKLFYGKHSISPDDLDAVNSSLRSGWLTNGPKVGEFEELFACRTGAKHAIAVSSGTAALHLTALSMAQEPLGERQGTVITTPLTFVASASAFIHAGFDIELVDIDDDTLNINPNLLEDKLKKKKIKGIVPVHFAGLMADMHAISSFAGKYGVWTVEDAAHALGAFLPPENMGKSFCGDCRRSNATTFSFHPVKHITTGEGGVITTNEDKVKQMATFPRGRALL